MYILVFVAVNGDLHFSREDYLTFLQNIISFSYNRLSHFPRENYLISVGKIVFEYMSSVLCSSVVQYKILKCTKQLSVFQYSTEYSVVKNSDVFFSTRA